MYDITKKDSFIKISKYMMDIQQHGMSNISVLIIGNKKDMEGDRKATYVEGKSKADYYNV